MSRFETPGCSRFACRAPTSRVPTSWVPTRWVPTRWVRTRWVRTRRDQTRHVLAGGATLALVVQLGFWLGGSAGDALAQSAPVITNNPSVIVDLSVLEALGGGPVTLGASVLAADPGQRGPIATVPLAPAATASIGNRGSAPAPLRAPSAAPRSRLNADALAALGITAEVAPPPPAAAVQAPARQPVAETAARQPVAEAPSRQAAAAPQRRPAPEPAPAPEAAPVQRAAAAPPPPPAPAPAAAPERPVVTARTETTVPPPPELPEARVAGAAPVAEPPPARVTAPPPAAAPPEPAAETQTASIAPTTAAEAPAGGLLSIAFNEGSAVLPDGARGDLDDLVTALTGDPALKVQLRAFAAGTADTTSQARRLSLSRALAVRSFLIENGVQTTRMDVRALGNKSGDGPADRVDVVMVDQ